MTVHDNYPANHNAVVCGSLDSQNISLAHIHFPSIKAASEVALIVNEEGHSNGLVTGPLLCGRRLPQPGCIVANVVNCHHKGEVKVGEEGGRRGGDDQGDKEEGERERVPFDSIM